MLVGCDLVAICYCIRGRNEVRLVRVLRGNRGWPTLSPHPGPSDWLSSRPTLLRRSNQPSPGALRLGRSRELAAWCRSRLLPFETEVVANKQVRIAPFLFVKITGYDESHGGLSPNGDLDLLRTLRNARLERGLAPVRGAPWRRYNPRFPSGGRPGTSRLEEGRIGQSSFIKCRQVEAHGLVERTTLQSRHALELFAQLLVGGLIDIKIPDHVYILGGHELCDGFLPFRGSIGADKLCQCRRHSTITADEAQEAQGSTHLDLQATREGGHDAVIDARRKRRIVEIFDEASESGEWQIGWCYPLVCLFPVASH